VPRPGEEFPLSYEQEDLWFLARFAPESTAYNIPAVWRFRGDIDPQALAASIFKLIERHEVLRTRFVERDGVPVQIIEPAARAARRLRVRTLRPGEELDERLRLECDRPFDLSSPQRLRTLLVKASQQDCSLLLDVHHIVSDEWSGALLWRDFSSFYHELLGRAGPPLPALPIRYGDYAAWQRETLSGSVRTRLVSYWGERLAGLRPLSLPEDYPRPAVQTFDGQAHWFSFDGQAARALLTVGRGCRATASMCYLAVFLVLLAQWTGARDLAVGTLSSGRNLPELRDVAGYFVKTLVLRADLSGAPAFPELLARVRDAMIGALAHEALPFSQVVSAARAPRTPGRSPLFQVLYAYEAPGPAARFELPGARMEPEGIDLSPARFDLEFTVIDRHRDSATVEAAVEYNTALFRPETARLLGERFARLVTQIAAAPTRPLLHDQ